METATLSLWTSRPMKWITLFMGVWILSGLSMELIHSALFKLVDRPGWRHTPPLGNPRLAPESNTTHCSRRAIRSRLTSTATYFTMSNDLLDRIAKGRTDMVFDYVAAGHAATSADQ